ncbi:hypothetical protein B296_00015287 [Ensete ventricosum]|uniref:THO1-MOS11 C-terminal domain-containing protein n=1 Tax=Ensete ventricosum TaxID=4639 RepID=A0A427AJV2_ENSVE|nr:hypothetical protein B296_00015287 [Ensete ventricosum]
MDAPPSAEVVAPPAAAVPDNRPSSPTAHFPNPSSAPQKPEIHGNAEGPTGVVGQKETAPTAVEAAVVAGQSNSDASEAAPVTDLQKKLRRAERFGTPVMLSEEEKRNSRAERSEATPVEETRSFKSPLLSCLPVQGSIRLWFGTASTFDGGKIGGPLEEQKRKARAERCLLLLTQQIYPCALARPRSSRRSGSEVALGGESSWVRLGFYNNDCGAFVPEALTSLSLTMPPHFTTPSVVLAARCASSFLQLGHVDLAILTWRGDVVASLIFAISFPPSEKTFSRFLIRVLKMRSCAEPSGCSERKLGRWTGRVLYPGVDPSEQGLGGSSGDGLAGSYTRELIRASMGLGDDSTEHELIRPSGGWGNGPTERELGKCPGAEEDVSLVFHRPRSMKDLFKTTIYKDDACYYALHMFERGLLHPQLAWELYTLPSEVLLARAARVLTIVGRASELERELEKTKRERDEALQRLEASDKELNKVRSNLSEIQRLLKEVQVKAWKMDDELLQSVKALENARAELPRRTVDHYKEPVGFKEGLKRMGRVTYEYGYRVALAHFRSLHPDSEVEEDPFTIRPEDDSVPMERQQAFDDSAPPKT